MQALAELEYPGKLQRLLLTPEREVLVELVITKDNGEIETFNAYRVQHSNSRGPYKGGLRYHPQVDLDDIRRRAHAFHRVQTREPVSVVSVSRAHSHFSLLECWLQGPLLEQLLCRALHIFIPGSCKLW